MGDVLEIALQSPTYETKQYGTVPVVDAAVTHDPATGQVSLFAVNRSEAEHARGGPARPAGP